MVFPTHLTVSPNSFRVLRNSTGDLRCAIPTPFILVVVILKKRVLAHEKKEERKKERKEQKLIEKGVKQLFPMHSFAALVCDNACIHAHISSLI